jgi:hypothetical protein
MAQATRAWLAIHRFPNADQVLFCSSPQEKLHHIIEQTVKNSYHLIVIDGRHEQLLAHISSLNPFLVKRIQSSLTLCAFGVVEVARSATVEMVAFPAWEHIDAFIQAWMKVVEKRYVDASPRLKCRR